MSLTAVLSHTPQCYRAGLAERGGQHLITQERLYTPECKIVYLFERHKNPFFLTSVIISRMGVGERERESDCEFPSKGQRDLAI